MKSVTLSNSLLSVRSSASSPSENRDHSLSDALLVVICEPQLKPSIENQAISRAYRMGQTRNVLVYRLLCENTIDERVTNILAEKQRAFNAFADESAAAVETIELDKAAQSNIIEQEIERIQKKGGKGRKRRKRT